MAQTLQIAPVTRADHAVWESLWQGYLDFYETSLPPQMSALTFDRITGGDASMGGFLAWRLEGQGRREALGLVHFLTHRGTWTRGDHCYLEDLFVAPGVRGGGVGRALIQAVAAEARARGCERLYWLTSEGNATARRLYDSLAEAPGFIQYRMELD